MSFANLRTSEKIQWVVSFAVPICLLLTPMALQMKLFLAIALWGILTIAFGTMHILVPSLVMPALFVLTGLAPASAVYSPWASTTISLAIGSLIMANCLGECGLLERLAYWMLQKCGGKFTTVCWGIFIVSTILSIATFGNIAYVIAAMVYGIIKVLGCDMKVIRNMFLLESGFIGFMGGVVGLAFSEAVSFAINHLLNIGQSMTGMSGNISRIPLWLAAASLAFAVFIGMAAGFFPALRAMKLSPLAAIRNE